MQVTVISPGVLAVVELATGPSVPKSTLLVMLKSQECSTSIERPHLDGRRLAEVPALAVGVRVLESSGGNRVRPIGGGRPPLEAADPGAHPACFCGAVEIEANGAPIEIGFCHCGSCRVWSGAPLVAFTLWKAGDVRVARGAAFLGAFNKSGWSNRRFCSTCGGHLMTEHPTLGFTDIPAAVLPSVAFAPTVHLNYSEAVMPIRDGLPKLKDFPAEAGGSGEAMPE